MSTINIGIDSLDSALTYVGAEPAPTLIQVGGQPGIMLSFGFAWLKPTVAYGQESVALDVPPGQTRALLDWFNVTPTDGANSGNQNVLLGTLNYDGPVFAEYFNMEFGADGGFFVLDGSVTVNIASQINLVNNVASIPEPTTAMLIGLGLVGLGVAGRRKV